jgi:hypothetical protein
MSPQPPNIGLQRTAALALLRPAAAEAGPLGGTKKLTRGTLSR